MNTSRLKKLVLLWCSCVMLDVAAQSDTLQKVIAGRHNTIEQQSKPYVILISADGFRYDYAQKYGAVHLQALSRTGVAAESMIPGYPSVTFPNHYSIVTGMYPSHHGLIDNSFYDASKNDVYTMSNRRKVQDGSWYGGVPLWVLAEQQNMVTASFYWVGTEAAICGTAPTYSYIFNEKISLARRLAVVKEWLQLPADIRPHLITFYFPEVDHEGHMFGPEAVETGNAVRLIDESVAKLVELTGSLHLPVNFIFVSDHGMTTTDVHHTVDIPRIVMDTTLCKAVTGQTIVHVYVRNKTKSDSIAQALRVQAREYDVWFPDDTPPAWHYAQKDDRFHRIGDIILTSRYPMIFKTGTREVTPGKHGFDPVNKTMHAVFYAWGPQFKSGMTLPPFDNVHVYPLIARLLGLNYKHAIDGQLSVLKRTLR